MLNIKIIKINGRRRKQGQTEHRHINQQPEVQKLPDGYPGQQARPRNPHWRNLKGRI